MRLPSHLAGTIVLAGAGLLCAATHAQAPRTATAPGQATTAARPAPENARETPVRDTLRAFTAAYNAADSKALAGLFVESAVVVDPSGTETQGKNAIGKMYSASLQQSPGLKLESETEQVRFLTPDVARVEGRSRVFASSGTANEFTRFTALVVRNEGKWQLAELREQAAPLADVTPYERLQELEFMVGDWVDESEGNRVVVNVRWADKKSYLIRTYSVELAGQKASSGTMFVGWDPQSEQIKSWVFDSEGGHGEGYWTRTSGTQWIVKASGVLRDGRPTSATHIHTILNKDAVKTSSTDRIVGGQIAPDILDIVMVRRPPQPTPGAPAAAPAGSPRPGR